MKHFIKSTKIRFRTKSSWLNRIPTLFILSICLSYYSFAQGRIWFSELGVNVSNEQKVEYIGGSVNKSPALGYFANINNGGKKIAIGLQLDYSTVDLKNVNVQGVRKNLLHLWEYYVTLRYYPMIPTIRFWTKGAIRFTAGGSIGGYNFEWVKNDNTQRGWSPLQVSSVVFAGLCFSPFRNTSGISVKLNYRPQTYSMENFPLKNFMLKQSFSLSAALFIGPKIHS